MAEFTSEQWGKMTSLERIMAAHLQDLPHEIKTQYKFHPTRRWLSDFAIPSLKILIECEGGTYMNAGKNKKGKGGAHNRAVKYGLDCQKYNEASMLGWVLLRFDTKHVNSAYAMDTVRRAIASQAIRRRALSNLIDALPSKCSCESYYIDVNRIDPQCIYCYIGETEIMEASELL